MRTRSLPRVRTTKPVSSPVGAPCAAVATTGRSTVPPGGIVNDEVPGAIEEPGVAVCGAIETFQAPPPVPASESESNSGLRASWPSTLRKANESDEGAAKSFGVFAAATSTRPPPSRSTEASLVRAVSPQAGCAEVISADFTCAGDHAGCCCSSSATAPETCGAAMLVPSKTANGAPANSGSVEERIWPPGAATSGFSLWSKLVGPADEKLVTIPLRPVSISFGSLNKKKKKKK